MFQVMELQGEYEPWWFFDDWKKQIKSIQTFETFDEAIREYQTQFMDFQKTYPHHQTKKGYLTAFWDESQSQYCIECEDDIQLFHSLVLLKEYQLIEAEEIVSN